MNALDTIQDLKKNLGLSQDLHDDDHFFSTENQETKESKANLPNKSIVFKKSIDARKKESKYLNGINLEENSVPFSKSLYIPTGKNLGESEAREKKDNRGFSFSIDLDTDEKIDSEDQGSVVPLQIDRYKSEVSEKFSIGSLNRLVSKSYASKNSIE